MFLRGPGYRPRAIQARAGRYNCSKYIRYPAAADQGWAATKGL